MELPRINFIDAYCDRWCERCPLTARCSVFAAELAIGMCGNIEEGLELALGQPATPDPRQRPDWLGDFDNTEVSAAELAESGRREEERHQRTSTTPVMLIAGEYQRLSFVWLTASAEELLRDTADPLVREALEIIRHDSLLIGAKLHRALDGLDRHEHDDEPAEPIQNDWNGSAKVALISIERSTEAWRVIAQATGDEIPAQLGDQFEVLQREVERHFPRARDFIRPGFDGPAT